MNQIFFTMLFFIFFAGTASAVCLPQDVLPADGAWAKYDFIHTEPPRTRSGTLLFRMVGTTTRDGRECRWLEIEECVDKEDSNKNTIIKFLVQAKELAEDARGINVLSAWKRMGDNAITKLSDSERLYAQESLLSMFFTSPSDSKTAKLKRVIRLPKSQLTIATATQGKMKFPGGFEGIKTVWGYMKVSFGFAAIDVSVKSGDKLVVKMQMTLKDFGTGAKSALPDQE